MVLFWRIVFIFSIPDSWCDLDSSGAAENELPAIPCLTNPQHSLNIHRFYPPPSDQPALPLYIPPCTKTPSHRFHPPRPEQPLRIHIEGPLLALQKLLPEVPWHLANYSPEFPLAGGPKLAELAFEQIYNRKVQHTIAGDMIVRDEYKGWVDRAIMIDYYGITFDHLVPEDDDDPELLQINIVEIEDDAGLYAKQYNKFDIDPADYIAKQVLGAPRCCSTRKGMGDGKRINDGVRERRGK